MGVGEVAALMVALVLGAASAVFSAVETAVFSLDEERRRRLRLTSPERAAELEGYLRRPNEVVNALVLANTLVNLPLIIVLLFVIDLLAPGETEIGWTVALVTFGTVILVCDLVPKLVALALPVSTALAGVPLVRRLLPVVAPLDGWLQAAGEWLVARVVPAGMAPAPHLTDAELLTLIEIGEAEGSLNETEARLISELMKLGEESARHCMTPRVDLFFIPDDLSNEEAAAEVRRKRYRRVPVRGETPDDLIGVLDVKQFLLNPTVPYVQLLQPPSYVPETIGALDLLRSFLQRRQQMAVLLDEYGGIEGVVTLSDFIEELLGEEGPDSQSELYIETLGEGRVVAAGSARLDDIAELLHWEPVEGDVETIGGFVIERLGHLPRPGAVLRVDGWQITVRRATRKRIKEVLIEPVNDGDAVGAELGYAAQSGYNEEAE